MFMKLQISFDLTDIEKAVDLAKAVDQYADIFEIGMVLIYKYGISAVQEFRNAFPYKKIIVDTKIVDRAKESVGIFGQLHIDMITVMAGATKDTIQTVCAYAQDTKMKTILDLLDTNSIGQSAMDAKAFGIDGLVIHNTQDESDSMQLVEKWEMVRGNTQLPIFIGGKLNRDFLPIIHSLKPDGIIVGSAILKAADPQAEAAFFYEECQK